MKSISSQFTIRPPVSEDSVRVIRLIEQCETGEYGEPDTDLDELQEDWDGIDLRLDAWLVFAGEAELIAYAAVIPRGARLQFDLFLSPTWEGDALGRELLRRCLARSLSISKTRAGPEEVMAVSYLAHVNQRDIRVFEEAGFQLEKHHFQMRIDLDQPFEKPVWPPGLTIRTADMERDTREIYRLIQQAFARPGRTAQLYEEWISNMINPDVFQADLWFLAFAGEILVGACLCFAFPEMGWVRQLGVAERWRRKGLGTALLRHAFSVFYDRGFARVGLGVEADNPGAYAFYQKIGMERVRQYDEYVRRIMPVERWMAHLEPLT